MRRILDSDPAYGVVPLTALFGFSTYLQVYQQVSGFSEPLLLSFILAAIIGPIVGFAAFFIAAFLLELTGGWLGGQAPRDHLTAALAWGQGLPTAVAGVLLTISFPLTGLVAGATAEPAPSLAPGPLLMVGGLLLLVLGLLLVVVSVWGVFLFLKCLAEAQEFSAWKSLGNATLAAIPSLLIGFLLLLLVA